MYQIFEVGDAVLRGVRVVHLDLFLALMLEDQVRACLHLGSDIIDVLEHRLLTPPSTAGQQPSLASVLFVVVTESLVGLKLWRSGATVSLILRHAV